jgi:hypothetical protein
MTDEQAEAVRYLENVGITIGLFGDITATVERELIDDAREKWLAEMSKDALKATEERERIRAVVKRRGKRISKLVEAGGAPSCNHWYTQTLEFAAYLHASDPMKSN